MMGLDNPIHILFLLVLLLLVFGAKRLPEMGRSLGSGLRGFKESISGETPAVHAEPARDRRRATRWSPRLPSRRASASARPSVASPSPPRSRQGIRMSLWSRARTSLAPGQVGFPDQLHERPVVPDGAPLHPARAEPQRLHRCPGKPDRREQVTLVAANRRRCRRRRTRGARPGSSRRASRRRGSRAACDGARSARLPDRRSLRRCGESKHSTPFVVPVSAFSESRMISNMITKPARGPRTLAAART